MENQWPVHLQTHGLPRHGETHAWLQSVWGSLGSLMWRPCRSLMTRSGSPQTGHQAWQCHGTSRPPICCREASTAIPSTPRCTWTPGARTQWSCSSTMWSPWSSLSPPMPSGELRRAEGAACARAGGWHRAELMPGGRRHRGVPGGGFQRDSEGRGEQSAGSPVPPPLPPSPTRWHLDQVT